jgi:hypothetical protein
MSRLVYVTMVPGFEGLKTVSPIERANSVLLKPQSKYNPSLYNTFNNILAVQKKVKYTLSIF